MSLKKIIRTQLIIVLAALMSVAVLFGIDQVSAAPTQNPPAGNPAFPGGPQGYQGSQGPQGPQGNQGWPGITGPSGGPGPLGNVGANWYNYGLWLSNGWDGGCAFGAGLYIDTDGSGHSVNFVKYSNCSPGQGV